MIWISILKQMNRNFQPITWIWPQSRNHLLEYAILTMGQLRANTAKTTINVWDFLQTLNSYSAVYWTWLLEKGRFPQRKCLLKEICIETILMKNKEQIINLSNQNYVNCRKIRSQIKKIIIPIYGRPTFSCDLTFCCMKDINKTI